MFKFGVGCEIQHLAQIPLILIKVQIDYISLPDLILELEFEIVSTNFSSLNTLLTK